MFSMLPHITTIARDAACYKNSFFGFPHWYQYLDVDKNNATKVCQVINFDFPGDLTLIAMAVLDMALRLVGMIAVGFVIYGAIQYVTSRGEPDGVKNAQNTIINALIGLTIAVLAAGIVRFIGTRIAA
jgi:hypothetical protein